MERIARELAVIATLEHPVATKLWMAFELDKTLQDLNDNLNAWR